MDRTLRVRLFRRLALFSLVLAALQGQLAWSQTFVQLADLDPPNALGPRLTETVTRNKLNGNPLFANIASKITLIDALPSTPRVFEFASDGMWNRVLFGEKDVYIRAFQNAAPGAIEIAGPGGLDVSALRTLFISDRLNTRIVGARFDPPNRTLTQTLLTPETANFSGIQDVAWDGRSSPLTDEYIYILDGTGQVSYWQWLSPTPLLLWTYGTEGSGTGQFNGPRGICVGHTASVEGGSVFTQHFYVSDAGNRRLVWLERTSTSPLWRGVAILPDSGVAADCTVDHFGNVYVADSKNSRLMKYTWNLTHIESYGSYGLGASNHNTFAHPQAIHAPFGTRRNSSGNAVWYGEGRIITAEDWGAESGAREHYLGMDGAITAQPQTSAFGDAWFSYRTTDHGLHTINVVDLSGNYVRTIPPAGIIPPGTRTAYWDGFRDDGTPAPTGTYWFQATAATLYNCSGQSWCQKGLSTQTFFHEAGGGCGGPCSPPIVEGAPDSLDVPTKLLLRQRVVGSAQPLTRIASSISARVVTPEQTGSLSEGVRRYGIRGLMIGVPRESGGSIVSIRVYSLAARHIRTLVNESLQPGFYELAWDGLDDRGRAVAPGVYFAALTVGGHRLVQRLIIR